MVKLTHLPIHMMTLHLKLKVCYSRKSEIIIIIFKVGLGMVESPMGPRSFRSVEALQDSQETLLALWRARVRSAAPVLKLKLLLLLHFL